VASLAIGLTLIADVLLVRRDRHRFGMFLTGVLLVGVGLVSTALWIGLGPERVIPRDVLLGILAAVEFASLWTGLALIAGGLLFVRDRRRLVRMLTTGATLVGVALLLTYLIIGIGLGGPDGVAPSSRG
jgi:hypothetical protein